jgi:hypothetical protein
MVRTRHVFAIAGGYVVAIAIAFAFLFVIPSAASEPAVSRSSLVLPSKDMGETQEGIGLIGTD